MHDSTAQTIAEDARKRLIQKLGDLAYVLDLTHTMIRDLDGTIVRWTAGAQRLYGWTAAEAEGRKSHILLRTEFPEPLETIERKLLENGEWDGHLLHTSKSGERCYVASHWALRKTDHAAPPLVIEVNNDITEMKRVQLALEKANRDLSSFSYEVAHDLQSPLRSMAMCAQLLSITADPQLTPQQSELIHTIAESSDRLRRLVESLLRYASMGAAGDRVELSLRSVVERVLENLAALIAESNACVRLGELPEVCAHEGKLLQIFQNLIGNALKYRRPGIRPEIYISADSSDTWWTVHVQDNGLGIEPGAMERVFAPLQRLHGPEISGTGLGLAICRRAVEAEGGQIWLDSTVGQGSTFHFTLKHSAPSERKS